MSGTYVRYTYHPISLSFSSSFFHSSQYFPNTNLFAILKKERDKCLKKILQTCRERFDTYQFPLENIGLFKEIRFSPFPFVFLDKYARINSQVTNTDSLCRPSVISEYFVGNYKCTLVLSQDFPTEKSPFKDKVSRSRTSIRDARTRLR